MSFISVSALLSSFTDCFVFSTSFLTFLKPSESIEETFFLTSFNSVLTSVISAFNSSILELFDVSEPVLILLSLIVFKPSLTVITFSIASFNEINFPVDESIKFSTIARHPLNISEVVSLIGSKPFIN